MSAETPRASPSQSVHTSAPKILPLTSLRFFAALLVVIQHTVDQPASTYHLLWLGNFLNMGFAAVSFFFMLSGYILAIVYLRHGKPLDRRRFWIARIARIYPLYFLTLCVDAPHLLLLRTHDTNFPNALGKTVITFGGDVAMLQAWVYRLTGIDFPNWSLSVEAFFYLVFPFIGVALWRLSPRRVVLLAALTYFGGLAVVFVFIHSPVNVAVTKYDPVFHLIPFVLGIALARVHTAWMETPRLKRLLHRLVPLSALTGIGLLVVIIQYSDRLPYLLMHDGLLSPAFACLILAFASGDHLLARIVSLPWLVVLGEASYGLYLIHIPLWNLLLMAHLVGKPLVFPLYMAGAIGLSVLSFYRFETPARRLILNYFAVPTRETRLSSSMAQ